MPSRAYTSFLQGMNMLPKIITDASVNALSGLYLISTRIQRWSRVYINTVSMPSRAYTSFLLGIFYPRLGVYCVCQCPLGLIPHFYAN